MKIFEKVIELNTKSELEFVDITEKVRSIVKKSKMENWLCLIMVPGSTGAVFLNEYDSDLIDDLKKLLKMLVPDDQDYEHPVNARSHLRAILLGNNQCISIKNNDLELGTWQQIIFVNLDTIPRERRVIIKIIGE